MKSNPIIFLILCFILTGSCFGQDTLIIDHNGYSIGKHNNGGDKIGWWSYYDSLGLIQKKLRFKKKSRYQKTITYEYSDENWLFEVGRMKRYSGKDGKWIVYDSLGEIERIEKYKYGDLHGKVKYIKTHKKTKYYFGLTKKQLYNSKGQRYVFYFRIGMPRFNDYSCPTEKFACIIYPIAGCFVTHETRRKQIIHNFFVNLKQTARFGIHWKDKYFKRECQ